MIFMLRDKNGELNYCPFRSSAIGQFGCCVGSECVAYDVIPAEYTSEGKPVERCLMMMSPFYPAPCCGPITEIKEDKND